MRSTHYKNDNQSGQVLITGVIMLIILLAMLLSVFDVHNLIRAKFKFETAQQAAALTGAEWQKKSLNLIGELNILKACVTLLEGEKNWDLPLPPYNKKRPELRKRAIQGRIDQITEMQTRVSFIGPMIGYGASQQAAKANGMRTITYGMNQGNQALSTYINRLKMRYVSGAVYPINNYEWFTPYLSMVTRIADAGVAVLPNARGTGRPTASPSELGNESFYNAIMQHKNEITQIINRGKRTIGDQSSWMGILYRFVKDHATWTDHVLGETRYWEIDYNQTAFPNESEIFTLGVQTGFSSERYWDYEPTFHNNTSNDSENQKYASSAVLPGDMKWFCYDDTWYPDYYRRISDNYQNDHFNYWFGGTILKSKVKPQYHYEGTAAYAETASLEISRALRFKTEKKYSKSGLIQKTNKTSTTVGPISAGSSYEKDTFSTDYRPGAIAKVLGELKGNLPPITIPVVLPVFDKTSLMPTYMPIPRGFEVLRNFDSTLDNFLAWLSNEEVKSVYNYPNAPEEKLKEYLTALQTLSMGKEFRHFAYNPNVTKTAQQLFEEDNDFLFKWESQYPQLTYSLKNQEGLGWLQEPRRCYEVRNSNKKQESKKTVCIADNINKGTATRYYVSNNVYYVVDSTGKVITNEDSDPTLNYNTYSPSGTPGGDPLIHSQYSTQKGTPRI